MKVAIIGAGVSGLAAARSLLAVGLDVTVYDSSSDIGGVWSAGRRYPGLSLQSDKQSYAFSDAPMPRDFPRYPTGAEVRAYIADFARREGLDAHIHLNTRVLEAEFAEDHPWRLTIDSPSGKEIIEYDWLIVANGLNCWSYVPDMQGRDEFEAAGAVVLTPSELADGEVFEDRSVVVLGYGKSAADAVVASARTARSTHMIVRAVAWKLPRSVGRVTFQHLLLTRGGEFVLWAPYRTLSGRVARVITRPIRAALTRSLERGVRRELRLDDRGLVPATPITSLTHLTTDGFFSTLDRHLATVHAGVSVSRLSGELGHPSVHLSDGTVLEAEVLVAATGYDQDIRFFGPKARAALLGDAEELSLERHTIPTSVANVAFIGWAESFRSPLGAEIQSLWLAAHIRGLTRSIKHRQPLPRSYRLTHEAAARRGLRLTSTGSGFIDLDEWIEEAGFSLPRLTRLRQWLRPLDPTDYRAFLPRLVARWRALEKDMVAETTAVPIVAEGH